MKRSILLFTAVAGMAYLTLSSNSTGPAASMNGNRTGSNPNPNMNTCGGLGCHGANTTNTAVQLFATETTTGIPVSGNVYKPNTSYTLVLAGGDVSLPTGGRYGFQLTSVKSNNTQAGTFANTSATNVHVTPVNGIEVVEHSVPISGGSTFSVPGIIWVSPGQGTGAVTFHAIVNAVNGNGVADAGDHATTAVFTYSQSASVGELSETIRITAYPNPATDLFSLKFEDADKGTYDVAVIAMSGQTVHKESIRIDGSNAKLQLQSSGWTPGVYMVRIMKDGAQRVITVNRQ